MRILAISFSLDSSNDILFAQYILHGFMLTEIYNGKSVKSKLWGTTIVTDTFIIYTLLGLKFTNFFNFTSRKFCKLPKKKIFASINFCK